MRCDDVGTQLLLPDGPDDGSIRAHVATCADCAALARRSARLDAILRPMVVQAPPADLQAKLVLMARAASREESAAGSDRWGWLPFSLSDLSWLWAAHPPTTLAQVVALIVVMLAGWQVFGWFGNSAPILGNVPYALELVIGSPGMRYLADAPIDIPSLLLWLAVGAVAWAVSESGPLSGVVARLSRPR